MPDEAKASAHSRSVAILVTVVFASIPLARECMDYAKRQRLHAEAEQRFEARADASSARRAAAEAEGRARDTMGCIAWATTRCQGQATCDACTDDLFGCLRTARKDAAFCTGVPRYTAETASDTQAWRDARRDAVHLTDWSCSAMFKFVQLHCHPIAPAP